MKKFKITFTLLLSFVSAFLLMADYLYACDVEVERLMKKEKLENILTCLKNKIVQLEQESNQRENEANQFRQEINQRENEANQFRQGINQRENEANQFRQEINQLKSRKDLPIGTIIPSMLKPSQFKDLFNSLNNSKIITWVLADGRDVSRKQYAPDVSASRSVYAERIADKIPDLRGMFLRGMNEGRSDVKKDPDADDREGGNIAGSYQKDTFQGHHHKLNYNYDASEEEHDTGNTVRRADGPRKMKVLSPITDGINGTPRTSSETRPKNIAVYYYIKIN